MQSACVPVCVVANRMKVNMNVNKGSRLLFFILYLHVISLSCRLG